MAEVRVLTPPGPGGVAVLSVRGPDARERVGALVASALPGAGGLCVVRLARGAEDLDEGIVCVRSEGEIELHLHGSPPLVQEIAELLADGAPAPGPLSLEERAFERAGAAPSEEGARVLLDQAGGALRRSLEGLLDLGWEARLRSLEQLVERGRRTRFLLEPPLVVLAGPVNAGKSTLFNVVVGERRVVVSAEAGTTRDAVRAPAVLGAWPIELVDTAGERALQWTSAVDLPAPDTRAADLVERAGQDLGREVRAAADLVLWLVPFGVDAAPPEGAVPLRTFADRRSDGAPDPTERAISAVRDPAGARDTLERVYRERFGLPESGFEPGAGAPFDADQRAVLEGLLARHRGDRPPDLEELERAVAGLTRPADSRGMAAHPGAQ